MAHLNPLINRFNERPGGRIVIRYAEGDEGVLWSAELRAWLVALGIPAARIDTVRAAMIDDILVIDNLGYGEYPH